MLDSPFVLVALPTLVAAGLYVVLLSIHAAVRRVLRWRAAGGRPLELPKHERRLRVVR